MKSFSVKKYIWEDHQSYDGDPVSAAMRQLIERTKEF